MAALCESWHAADPGKGHAAKAADWRGKVEDEATKPRSHEGTKGNGER